jgi:hypothetical protein
MAAGCEESRAPAAAQAASTAASPEPAPAVEVASEQPSAQDDAQAEVAVTEPAATETKPATAPAKPAAPAGVQDITFDTIKFPLEKNEPYDHSKLTPAIEALNGRHVKLRGYILPSFQQSGITQFVLVRDNMQCCFGPGAALYDCVVVDMKPGKTTDFTVRPVAVEGIFELRDFKGPDGKYLAIYHLDGEAVRF